MQVEKYPGDMLGADYHEIRVAKNPLEIDGPITTITARPGLGVEVDWDLVKRCGLRVTRSDTSRKRRRGSSAIG